MSLGDFALETTIHTKFLTRAFATGVPTTLSGSPVIDIYENNSVTQITAAETLTVDFDSVTGLNHLAIAATAANGFESGKFYQAVITTGTVNGVSVVGEVVAEFSIEAATADVRKWLGTAVQATSAGIPDINVFALDDNAAIPPIMSRWYGNGHVRGTSDSGTTSTMTDTALSATNNEAYVGSRIKFTSGTNNGVEVLITSFNAATDTVAFTPTLSNAVTTENYILFPGGYADTLAISASAIASILTTQMTESYSADGAAPTLAQALMLIQQMLGDFAISGTTMTVKKVDGSTTAATFTLNDGTNPTSLTRAT